MPQMTFDSHILQMILTPLEKLLLIIVQAVDVPINAGELSLMAGVPQSAATSALNDLAKKGLIERRILKNTNPSVSLYSPKKEVIL